MKIAQPTCTEANALERQAEPGWLLPYLTGLDTLEIEVPANVALPGKPKGIPYQYKGHGRWTWWIEACYSGEVPPTPIPPIRFDGKPDENDRRAIRDVLTPFVQRGLGWYDEAWLAMVRWILYGFGYKPDEMEVGNIPAPIRATWYRSFNLGNLLHSPCDWSAYVLQGGLTQGDNDGSRWAKTSGFYSTPMGVVNVLTAMTFGGDPSHEHKFQSVADPCVGTGSMLLAASNYSLLLYGMDIVYDLCLCATLNGYLWMPWLVAMPDRMRGILNAGPTTGVRLATDPADIAYIEEQRLPSERP